MGVKPGYKQTDAGVIPDDWLDHTIGKLIPAGWEMSKLGNVSEVFFSNVDKKTHLDEIPVLLCNYMDVYSNSYIRSGLKFMQATAEQREIDKFLLKKGDVIITKDSETPDDIAVATYVSEELDNVLCGYHLAIIRTNKKQLDSGYLAHLFGLDEMQHYYYQLANGSTRFGLTTDAILDSRIPTPPLPEQKAIAEALSDTDALIESLEQLIAKKRQIKQGAMQELLTGKKRLQGFQVKPGYKQTDIGVIPEDWKERSLNSFASVVSGKRLPLGRTLTDHETPHPYIRVTDMAQGTVALADLKFVPVDVFPAIRRYRIFKEDIFISVAGTLGIIGRIPAELDGANLTENADRITNIKCSQGYLLYFMRSPAIQNQIKSLQTLGAQPKLALTRIRKFVIPLPPTLAEQEDIAEALSDMDDEINTLEVKLEKNHKLKQGMMQELLTGRIRLI